MAAVAEPPKSRFSSRRRDRDAQSPPLFPPQFASLDDITGPWWVVQTHPLRERTLARKLLECSVPYFFPYERLRKYQGGRYRLVDETLFPAYLFFAGSP